MTRDISIALYRYLCLNIVGREDYVKQSRMMTTVRDNLTCNGDITVVTSGSFGEGLDMRGSDLDMMYVFKKVEVYGYIKPCFNQNVTYFSMDRDAVNPGFTQLQLRVEHSSSLPWFKYCEKRSGKYYLSSALYKQDLLIMDKTNVIHGPCISDEYGMCDSVSSLHCKTWITPAVQWITRPNNSWPNSKTKQSIIEHGVLFVPIGVKGSPNENIEWRISFSVGEKLLINTFTYIQLFCYALLKIILKDLISIYSECKDLLCSYFLKTIMFWISEEQPQSIWKPENLISCFTRCFRRLLYCVKYSLCVHYFIPENNMFENRIEGRARELLLEKLYTLNSYGWRCILFSDQISNFDVSIWSSPSKTETLNLYEVEKVLFSNLVGLANTIFRQGSEKLEKSVFKRKIYQAIIFKKPFVKYLYTYYISMMCSVQAQSIQLNCSNNSNKYLYKQFTSCVSILLQNIYHDAVSGWLMIASFFYKTKQYHKALHIISYSLSKCDMKKLCAHMCIPDLHVKLIDFILFHKKSFVYLLKIMFVDVLIFQKNSELIPDELQMEVGSEIYRAPSTAYASFLNFLCHYHLNNTKQCYDSLQDLQLVIKESYLIADRINKAQAYNLLGIIFTLLRVSKSARKAFLRSVNFLPDPLLNSSVRRYC
ncbi:uncharacterized protein [Mytilus edulis]|uniref:uncharacterized protein n=1 Tax=Mytilus edulis TaxID=6550 RepID=UPI0039EDF03E